MTVREVLALSAQYLAERGVPSPRVDAEWLLAHALGLSRLELYTEHDRPLSGEELAAARELLRRRGLREPLAYVLGEWGFRRLTLKTDARALVPRPETEILVERCLVLLAGKEEPRVLDVGAGSGAIALSIADEHHGAHVTAVDTSADALALARENAERTGLSIELRQAGFEAAAEGWDLVVSNPPYIGPGEIGITEPEVRDWEPRGALVGEGLHEELARVAQTEWLVVEVGDAQAPRIAAVLTDLGYADVAITPDLAGSERVVEGRR